MDGNDGVTQGFQGSVGQVAGGNIYNYYNNNKEVPAIPPEIRKSVAELLAICDPCGQRKLIEKISFMSFGTTDFKSLDVEKIRALIDIASDVSNAINKVHVMMALAKEVKAPWWRFWVK